MVEALDADLIAQDVRNQDNIRTLQDFTGPISVS
jgi:hypothetical protein